MLILLQCFALLAFPGLAWADAVLPIKDPLSYPLKQYAFILGVSVLGGLVNWFARLRSGEVNAWNLMQLIGELCTSAFGGLLAFWACEWMNVSPLLTAATVGIAGHMGTRGIVGGEKLLEAYMRQREGKGA